PPRSRSPRPTSVSTPTAPDSPVSHPAARPLVPAPAQGPSRQLAMAMPTGTLAPSKTALRVAPGSRGRPDLVGRPLPQRRCRLSFLCADGGWHLDDHRGRRPFLRPVVGQRHSGAVAQEAEALADRTNVDRTNGRLPQDVGAAQDLRQPRGT